MGISVQLLVLFAFAMVCTEINAVGECPQVSQVYSCKPKCVENYECTNGRVCCPNSCNAKSCTEPSKYTNGSGSSKDKYGSGSGTYCNNVKCSPYEVCKMDKSTNRMKCQRA